MVTRTKLRQSAAPHLLAGERIQAAFVATTGLAQGGSGYRAVVVTDRRILLFSLSFTGKAKDLLGEFDRDTQLGPAHGAMHYATDALGVPLLIHRRFFGDVADADAARSSGPFTGLGPPRG